MLWGVLSIELGRFLCLVCFVFLCAGERNARVFDGTLVLFLVVDIGVRACVIWGKNPLMDPFFKYFFWGWQSTVCFLIMLCMVHTLSRNRLIAFLTGVGWVLTSDLLVMDGNSGSSKWTNCICLISIWWAAFKVFRVFFPLVGFPILLSFMYELSSGYF